MTRFSKLQDALASPQPDAGPRAYGTECDKHGHSCGECDADYILAMRPGTPGAHDDKLTGKEILLTLPATLSNRDVMDEARDIYSSVTWSNDPDWCRDYIVEHLSRYGQAAAAKMREAVVTWHEAQELAIRNTPLGREGLHTTIQGAHMNAHRESAAYFRTLPVPHDVAAETKEME